MRLRALVVALALVVSAGAVGCGGDDGGGGGGGDGGSVVGDTSTPKGAIITWLLEGKCEVMTDKFLESQAFIGDTREERCEFFEKQFSKPQFTEDDIEVTNVKITGDKATATVGGGPTDITSDYTLIKSGDVWQIDDAG